LDIECDSFTTQSETKISFSLTLRMIKKLSNPVISSSISSYGPLSSRSTSFSSTGSFSRTLGTDPEATTNQNIEFQSQHKTQILIKIFPILPKNFPQHKINLQVYSSGPNCRVHTPIYLEKKSSSHGLIRDYTFISFEPKCLTNRNGNFS
jgi:hypothetical protein